MKSYSSRFSTPPRWRRNVRLAIPLAISWDKSKLAQIYPVDTEAYLNCEYATGPDSMESPGVTTDQKVEIPNADVVIRPYLRAQLNRVCVKCEEHRGGSVLRSLRSFDVNRYWAVHGRGPRRWAPIALAPPLRALLVIALERAFAIGGLTST